MQPVELSLRRRVEGGIRICVDLFGWLVGWIVLLENQRSTRESGCSVISVSKLSSYSLWNVWLECSMASCYKMGTHFFVI